MLPIHVAVGVVEDSAGNILIALRSSRQHQGNLWEFPGGKVEPGESCHDALVRELKEEVGIDVLGSEPLIQIEYHYPDKSVFLDVRRVYRFFGTAFGREGQPIRWVPSQALHEYQFPVANKPILSAINLPRLMAVSGDIGSCVEFEQHLASAVARGAELFWLRTDPVLVPDWQHYLQRVSVLQPQLKVVVTSKVGEHLWQVLPGLHLTSADLIRQSARPVPVATLLGASCHDEEQVLHASMIGIDYITISPVLPTSTHDGEGSLGWERFSQLARLARCPAFALGGVDASCLDLVTASGGHGFASISYFWG